MFANINLSNYSACLYVHNASTKTEVVSTRDRIFYWGFGRFWATELISLLVYMKVKGSRTCPGNNKNSSLNYSSAAQQL